MTPDERNHFRQIIEASVNILKFAGQKPDSVTVGYGVVGKTLDLLNDADQLQSENARLRERLDNIEKAARLICLDHKIMEETEDARTFDAADERFRETFAALRAALDGDK